MWIELSHPLDEAAPRYPGNPSEKLVPVTRIGDGDVCNGSNWHHHLHNGTHVDAPWHFYDGGLKIDEVPLDNFVFTKPVLLDVPRRVGETIGRDMLESAVSVIGEADIVLLRTGHGRLRGDRAVYAGRDFPCLSFEAALFLRKELPRLKAIAIDALGVENPVVGSGGGNAVHRALLDGTAHPERPVLPFEDVNLAALASRTCLEIVAFPIRLVGMDASPVAMAARVEG